VNESGYQSTLDDALLALYKFGHIWTNPAPAPDHTTQEIGLELVHNGLAQIALEADGYSRLKITDKGTLQAQVLIK
jgi:hypothetical protein